MDPIALSIFSSRIEAVCDEMGAVLKRTAFSPNIKDRLDYSCAVFDGRGELCAQAAHIPVHLGSMAFAMRDIVNRLEWADGDMVVVNDPYLGGTHLPDVTLISPVMVDGDLLGFVANRAHHADIGATTPGSMPISASLEEEGLLIPPTHLYRRGVLQEPVMTQILAAMQNPRDSRGDFAAQASANHAGVARLMQLIEELGNTAYRDGLAALNDYGERLARASLAAIPDGVYRFRDLMDDDGQGRVDIPIEVAVTVRGGEIEVDFAGSAEQVSGNINCPLSVAAAGVYYVFRCLMPEQTPACAGSFRPISLRAPEGCLLNARRPAAVAAGNVETSTRVVDVVMGALAPALPERIPAASHGSMNNLAMGATGDPAGLGGWSYYETIGGGMGAGALGGGLDALQTHMTNTLNTPVESLEMHYPLRIDRYAIRRGSGGRGRHPGGNGIIRQYTFLAPTTVTLLTERRRHTPWGLAGGGAGQAGRNLFRDRELAAKTTVQAEAGDSLSVETPGGGGWGKP